MNKLHLTFFVLSLLIAVSAALSIDHEPSVHSYVKRNNCPFVKRDILSKRNVKKCHCTLARSIFVPKKTGPIKGLVIYAQDECGSTTITGLFSRGFKNVKSVKVFIVDSCDRILYNVTKELDITPTNYGDTEPFSHKFDEINLDCGNDGILFPQTGKSPLNKRNCKRAPENDLVVEADDKQNKAAIMGESYTT